MSLPPRNGETPIGPPDRWTAFIVQSHYKNHDTHQATINNVDKRTLFLTVSLISMGVHNVMITTVAGVTLSG